MSIEHSTYKPTRLLKVFRDVSLSARIRNEDIERYPLLSEEEEHHFGQAMLLGRAAKIHATNPSLLPETRTALLFFQAYGVLATEHMINSNLRLARKVAAQNVGKGLPFQDLYQAGCEGLIRAAASFDYRKAKFSTYATNGAKRFVRRALENYSHTIGFPAHVVEMLTPYHNAVSEFENTYGRKPTHEEVAQLLHVTVGIAENIAYATTVSVKPFTSYPDREEEQPFAHIPDTQALSPEVAATNNIIKTTLRDTMHPILEKIPFSNRDKEIIARHFGFGQPACPSFKEIGETYGLSRERVRQIVGKMLLHLASNPTLKELYETYVE